MEDFVINTVGSMLVGGYITAGIIGQTTPTVNEHGEEEYTIPGYLLLAGSYLVHFAIDLVVDSLTFVAKKVLRKSEDEENQENVEAEPPRSEDLAPAIMDTREEGEYVITL